MLADGTRLRILDALRGGELSVLGIVGKGGASQPSVSRHLALLLRAGIVTRRPEGRNVHYRLVDPFVDQICETICGMAMPLGKLPYNRGDAEGTGTCAAPIAPPTP